MKKIKYLKNTLFVVFFSLLHSCSDHGTSNDRAPYDGEGIYKFISFETIDIQSPMILDTNYRLTTILSSDFEVVGKIYFYQHYQIDLNVHNAENISLSTDPFHKEDFKMNFHTTTSNNLFEIITDIKFTTEFNKNFIEGCPFSLKLQIDSIYIDSDTLYRSSLDIDSLNYPFIVPEKRWYARGQQMYDSTHSQFITDLEFLSSYFGNQLQDEIIFDPIRLYNDTIYIEMGQ